MIRKILFFMFFIFVPAITFASPTFNNVVIFGDSLSDNGNIYKLVDHLIPKSPPYFNGEFSNGAVWSHLLATQFKPLNVSTENYALGGEPTIFHFGPFLPITLHDSITRYYFDYPFTDRSKTLFIIWIGANDYLDGPKNVAAITDQVVAKIHEETELLIAMGGKNFLIMGLPDLGETPKAQIYGTAEILHELTIAHNQKLSLTMEQIQKEHANIMINYFDVATPYNDMLQNIDKYNEKYHTHINNLKDACWQGGYTLGDKMTTKNSLVRDLSVPLKDRQKFSPQVLADYISGSPDLMEAYSIGMHYAAGEQPCSDPDAYVFWDHVHPSAPVHRIFAGLIEDFIKQHYVIG